jgi:isocitrate dehydrogenase
MLTHDVALAALHYRRKSATDQYAFEMAKENARRVTCGHKANIMKLTDGLFLTVFMRSRKNIPSSNRR